MDKGTQQQGAAERVEAVGLTRAELMRIASEAYERSSGGIKTLKGFFDAETGEPTPDNASGSWLARHVVEEISEAFNVKINKSDEEKLAEVERVLSAAQSDLEVLIGAFSERK